MKYLTLILLFLSNFTFALNPSSKQKLSSHLLEVNKNWKNQDVSKFEEELSFNSDIDRIQKHLFSVIELLEAKKTHFSQNQLENRLYLLNELQIYAENKVFPINLFYTERTPYFIDHLGTHCAVGYLMLVSGNGDLAQEISKNENYAYVKDIQTKGVVEWAEIQGFSLEELALIQPTYQNPDNYENIDGTTNGPVKHLVPVYDVNLGSRLYFGGDFTELKGLPCTNIGYYQNNQLSCLAGGLNGKLVEIKNATGNQLIACGEFLHNGAKFQIAKLVNNSWEFSALPISGEFEVLAFDAYSGSLNNTQYRMSVAIHRQNAVNSEIWSLDNNSIWTKKAETNGEIYVIESENMNKIIYGGKFDRVYIYSNNELINYLSVNNVVSHNVDFLYDDLIQGTVSDTVTSILISNSSYYFGGKCERINNSVAVSRFLDGVMQPLIMGTFFWSSTSQINRIAFDNSNIDLLICGDFSSGNMNFGKGFANYYFGQNGLSAINNFNGIVYDFVYFNDRYYFAGDFFNTSLNAGYLVREPGSIGISEKVNSKLTIFPNPATNKLQFDSLKNSATYEIRDNLGRIIQTGQILNHEINIENLSISSYNISIFENDKIYNAHFFKN